MNLLLDDPSIDSQVTREGVQAIGKILIHSAKFIHCIGKIGKVIASCRVFCVDTLDALLQKFAGSLKQLQTIIDALSQAVGSVRRYAPLQFMER